MCSIITKFMPVSGLCSADTGIIIPLLGTGIKMRFPIGMAQKVANSWGNEVGMYHLRN